MTGLVLGVNFGTHDAAAAIVSSGRVLAAAEEERFNRRKHTKDFPAGAIDYVMREAGAEPGDLEKIALFVDPKRQLLMPAANLWHAFPASLGSLRSDLAKSVQRARLRDVVRSSGRFDARTPIVPVVHHRAHAASAFLTSPFEDALVVTIDGRGEYETACVFHGRGGRLMRRHSMLYPHSIGYLYSMVTRFLGFRPQRDEYKVMGLAAHGTPALADAVSRLARFDEQHGRLRLDLDFFDHHRRPSGSRNLYSPRLTDLLGPARNPEDPIEDRHRDIAYGVQTLAQQLIVAYVRFARRLVPSRRLCLAGGVALNSVANAAILASGWFDEVFIQPAANDAGSSIGAALSAAGSTDRSVMAHAFLGPEPNDIDIKHALRDHRPRQVNDPFEAAARLIDDLKVIGWFQGRMEFGPRALGHRSILASAHDTATTERVNALIKGRERFRPLAPAVLAEDASDFFHLESAGREVYPFMLAIVTTTQRARDLLPAAVHVDGSARVQTVTQTGNPDFWRLIDAYRKRSGLPAILNTSFNGADEPIVCTPADAITTYRRCGLDALIIGDQLVERPRE